MKTNKPKRANLWRIVLRRSSAAHGPWLIPNTELFNFGGSLSQVLTRQQEQQFGRLKRRNMNCLAFARSCRSQRRFSST